MLNKMKMIISILLAIVLIVGCTSNNGSKKSEEVAKNVTNENNKTQSKKESKDEKVKIKFYHADAEYNHKIIDAYKKVKPNVEIELVPLDWGSVETVVKTGIAAGDPVDISFMWPSNLQSFFEAGIAENLSPYLKETTPYAQGFDIWEDSFVDGITDVGRYADGNVYGISYQPAFPAAFYNKTLLDKYGISVPKTWDEFLEACKILKENGIYGYAMDHHKFVFKHLVAQIALDNGTYEDMMSGKLPLDGEEVKKALELTTNTYQEGYWYPGEASLTTTHEEVLAGFLQGKAAFYFCPNSTAGKISIAEFEVGVMPYPTAGEKTYSNLISNGLFIPYNAKNKEAAVDFMKFYTGDEGQKYILESGRAPALKGVKVDNPVIQDSYKSIETDVIDRRGIELLSPQLKEFVEKELVAAACAGEEMDKLLAKFEKLRQEAIGK